MPNWTALGVKSPVIFYDPNNPSVTWSPQINPQIQANTPGSVRKYVKTTNGASIISGDREYPPTEIKISWDQLDYFDYQNLSVYTAISPVVFVDNNNQGYQGVLVIDKAGQVAGKTSNVWAIEASFLVLSPYDSTGLTLNRLLAPSLVISSPTTGGYVTGAQTLYFAVTVFSKFGESVPGPYAVWAVPAGTNTNHVHITWAQPSSSYFVKSRLYWSTDQFVNNVSMLCEVQAGQTGSFNSYANYYAYNSLTPPIVIDDSFTGYFAGGRWVEDV